MTHDSEAFEGYFEGAARLICQISFLRSYPTRFPKHHGVVACEGSMFKSKFANALTTMMIGSLGIAAAQNKLSVGYGAEAGHMDPLMAKMCARYCQNSFVITRNEESRNGVARTGSADRVGNRTAWTFEPLRRIRQGILRKAGWDGNTPVLVVCPINPFRVASEGVRSQVRGEHV